MSDFSDVEEAISAAQQAIRWDQDVDPAVVQVLLEVAERAMRVVSAVDDYTPRERDLAALILGEGQ